MSATPRLRTAPAGLLTVSARAERGGLAVVEGMASLPGLPVRRLRLTADADRLFLYGPDLPSLVGYAKEVLRADVAEELPAN